MARREGFPPRAQDINPQVPVTLPRSGQMDKVGRQGHSPAATLGSGVKKASRPNPIPWTPRTYSADGIELTCPNHLQIYTDLERDLAYYPDAAAGRFCSTCGRPVQNDGRTGKRGRGVGKPCPECGFKRKKQMTEKQLAWINSPERIARFNASRQAASQNSELQAARRKGKRKLKVSELLHARAEEEAEIVVRPYLEGLKLTPKEEWSPGTKLEFYMNQTQIAEKFLNRVEGMPVSRTRHVDQEDEDVLRDGELSSGTLIQLVAAIATGATEDFEGATVVEAEVIPDE
jgi:hypothetical protein